MSAANDKFLAELNTRQNKLAADVEKLAADVKLLAINLAIAMARLKAQKRGLTALEPEFSRLVNEANDNATRVLDVVRAFREQGHILGSLPASSRIIAQRGGYDKVEVKLKEVQSLSQDVIDTISYLQNRERTS